MDGGQIVGLRLTELARPYLARNDRDGLARRLEADWSPECLELLLDAADTDIVRVASVALGLIGRMGVCAPLARLLHHASDTVAAAAEEALWSIWFRDGGMVAQGVLLRIARAIRSGQTENVVSMLTELIRARPMYAEAHHQRSQAYYLEGSFHFALRDARRAGELNPWHFGALANQAHALVALGRFPEALEAYTAVLNLHPRMPGISESVDRLRERLFVAAI